MKWLAVSIVVLVGFVAGQSPLDQSVVRGRGASVSFVEIEAESSAAAHSGTVLGPDRTFTQIPSEASGRSAVQLSSPGQWIEFTLPSAANSINVRYSIPDSADGLGLSSSLGVYANGQKVIDLPTTSQYSWFYGSYPFTNDPSQGKAHHFFDESRALLGQTFETGTNIRLQHDDSSISWTIVDLADFELVADPAERPQNSVSVVDHGADPTGSSDSADALNAAIQDARHQDKEVWIPAGTFQVNRHIIVDRVTIRGAGAWHSVVRGNNLGFYGNSAPNPSSAVKLLDFSIIGDVKERNDNAQVNGVGGAIGGGSVISGLYIQHTKVGMWFDGPFDGLEIANNRIVDTTADGINLHKGISNVVVHNNFLRNLGDDGLAMWSEAPSADHDNVFSHNTVVMPVLANGIAIYGGFDNQVIGNVIADTLTQGGGIHLGNRFNAVGLAGTTVIMNNTVIRGGCLDPNWDFGVGAIWFWAGDSAITGNTKVSDLDLIDSSYEGIMFIGSSVSNVAFDNVKISKAGTFAVQIQSAGSGKFSNVTAAELGENGRYDCGAGFRIIDQGGNSGWTSSQCGWQPTTPTPSVSPSSSAPTLAPSSKGKHCDASLTRQDCGFWGVTQSQCEAKGCCWSPVDPNPTNLAWCFHPNSVTLGISTA
eukprot:TRINITY_DN3311_c0_g1_i7.p1 TRINITY_DN3311_c0_g1~~TRINITY_DN3311_c0_g1_i7.p1  ORF type:complete len:649 (+),score=172.66 TRINITY_DN3311_c0_g1_i7:100-2046(+)